MYGDWSSLSLLLSREELCLHLLSYLSMREVLCLECLSRPALSLMRNNFLWRFIYTTNFTLSDPNMFIEEHLRRKVHRPLRENCIGWQVNILQENGSNIWRKGVILDFRVNTSLHEEFLVDYDEETVWEEERRKNVAWHLSGLSRFDFLRPQHEDSSYHAVNRCDSEAASREKSLLQQFHSMKADCDWREECHRLYQHLPAQCLYSLEYHTDEVLDVEFSHDGTMLATVSRDGKIGVVELESMPDGSLCITRVKLLRTERDLHGNQTRIRSMP